MVTYSTAWRSVAVLLGIILAALGAKGAWEYAHALEGQVSYVVFAACVVGIAAAVLPAIAEWQWRDGAYVKALLLWIAFILCAAVVVTAVIERMHAAKALGEAERSSKRATVERATAYLTFIVQADNKARADSDRYAKWSEKACAAHSRCTSTRAAAARLSQERHIANEMVLKAEREAVTESAVKQPPWLLGIALWAGLTGPRPGTPPAVKRRRRKAAKRKPRPHPSAPTNVVPIHKAV
jgi:hypothetical protein